MVLMFESVYLDIITVSCVLYGLLYLHFTWNFNYWKKRGIPYLKPVALFGNSKDRFFLRKSTGELFQDHYRKLKKYKFGGVFQARRPTLVLCDPELIKNFMVKDFSHFHDRGLSPNVKANPLNAHLFNLEGNTWRQLRIKLSPTFTSGKMKMMFQLINDCALELRNYLADAANKGDSLEIKDVLGKYTTDVIGTCAFGLQFNSMKNPDSEFRLMGKQLFESSPTAVLKTFLLALVPALAPYLGISFPKKEVSDFFLAAYKDTVDYREKNNVQRGDFMQMLIQLKNKGKIDNDKETEEIITNGQHKEIDDLELTENLLAAQAFVFFVAGFETSSTTMTYCLHELAVNPEAQERARQEIDTVLRESGGQFTYDGVQKMEYLDRVVAETLRKYPPVPVLFRKCTKTYAIPDTNVEIEEGTTVFIPIYALQKDPEYFPDPERFDPDRFTEENKAKRHHYTYLPFGEGPRNCIGMRFGLMQTKVGLAALLSHYEFSVCQKTSVPQKIDPKSFITSSVGGNWLKITNRS